MTNPRLEFLNWLNQDPTRKKKLPAWEKFSYFLPSDKFGGPSYHSINYILERWQKEDGDFLSYLSVMSEWKRVELRSKDFFSEAFLGQTAEAAFQLIQIKKQKQDLETKIEDLKIELNDKIDRGTQAKNFYNYIFELYEKATANPENIETLIAEAKQEVKNIEEDDSEDESEEVISDFYQKIDKIIDFAKQRNSLTEQLTEKEQELEELREELVVKTRREEELVGELNQLQREKEELETRLQDSENTLTNTRQQLDNLKSELTKKEQELQNLTEQLVGEQSKTSDLEQQLTSLAISSGLLSQQVEQLNNQLTESQQQEERTRLEAEIKANLIREQNEKISGQESQITNYQNLLRTSEQNLKKSHQLINQKTNQLTKLEREKDLIGEELGLAQGKIRELEKALVSANGKISRLEAKVKELEKQNNNSSELERLKKELVTEKQKYQQEKSKQQQEINRLKSELTATKKREEELAERIKELGKKKKKFKETAESISFWVTIKKPALYTAGVVLVIIVLGWLWSKLSDN